MERGFVDTVTWSGMSKPRTRAVPLEGHGASGSGGLIAARLSAESPKEDEKSLPHFFSRRFPGGFSDRCCVGETMVTSVVFVASFAAAGGRSWHYFVPSGTEEWVCRFVAGKSCSRESSLRASLPAMQALSAYPRSFYPGLGFLGFRQDPVPIAGESSIAG
jgi:hypothetical protein